MHFRRKRIPDANANAFLTQTQIQNLRNADVTLT